MWSYSGNPAHSETDMVHYRLGDVDPAYPIATDEECRQALTDHGGNTYLAAAAIAETKALLFFLRPSREVRHGVTIEWGQQAEAFRTLAAQLRLQASITTAVPYAGGISVADKAAHEQDSDRVKPFATKTLHDFQGYSLERDERDV